MLHGSVNEKAQVSLLKHLFAAEVILITYCVTTLVWLDSVNLRYHLMPSGMDDG